MLLLAGWRGAVRRHHWQINHIPIILTDVHIWLFCQPTRSIEKKKQQQQQQLAAAASSLPHSFGPAQHLLSDTDEYVKQTCPFFLEKKQQQQPTDYTNIQ